MAVPLAPWLGLCLALATLVSPMAAHAEPERTPERTIEPGYWSYHASTLALGVKDGDQCVKPDKIDEFLSGPHNHHYTCTYPVRVLRNGEATFEGECVSKKHEDSRYRISLKGHYAPHAFDLHGRVESHLLGVPLSVPVSIEAHRLGAECPAAGSPH